MSNARWIRLGAIELLDLRAACLGLAESQAAQARPVILWGRASGPVCLGPRSASGAGEGWSCPEAPDRESLVWVEPPNFVFAVLAPQRFVPGRRFRWTSWALAPALATYRQFGVHAYLEANAVWLHGRRIAESSTACAGDLIIVASSFPARCGSVTAGAPLEEPSFRAWLRDGAALARSTWADRHETPAERELEDALRARIEAQHGWRFEHCWPNAAERGAIERARSAIEPVGVL